MKPIIQTIENTPIIPVFYHDDIDQCIAILKSCYEGGIRNFEFVNRGDNAFQNFKHLLAYKKVHFPELLLGIGTIKTKDQAKDFAEIGADFLVSPIVREDIARIADKYNLLWIPGCMTPTEIALAEELKAPLVKLFPGNTLGLQYLKAIKPIFPKLKFMLTGGVETNQENIASWFSAGVSAVGLGSQLFTAPSESSEDDWLKTLCKNLLEWSKVK